MNLSKLEKELGVINQNRLDYPHDTKCPIHKTDLCLKKTNLIAGTFISRPLEKIGFCEKCDSIIWDEIWNLNSNLPASHDRPSIKHSGIDKLHSIIDRFIWMIMDVLFWRRKRKKIKRLRKLSKKLIYPEPPKARYENEKCNNCNSTICNCKHDLIKSFNLRLYK